jgi:hypothetical protein
LLKTGTSDTDPTHGMARSIAIVGVPRPTGLFAPTREMERAARTVGPWKFAIRIVIEAQGPVLAIRRILNAAGLATRRVGGLD